MSITIMIIMMIEKEMMAAPHVDTVFSGTTMVLLIMQGESVSLCVCEWLGE